MEKKGRILVVDDDSTQRRVLCEAARSCGYDAEMSETPTAAIKQIRFHSYDVLLTDLEMPEMSGIQLLKHVHIHDPTITVVVVTGHGTVQTAVEALKLGAEDYVLKPVDLDALEILLKKIFEKREIVKTNKKLQSEVAALKKDLGIKYHLLESIGKSDKALKLIEEIKDQIKTKKPLLVIGEPGAGRKELAKMIHYNSPWANSSIITFDLDDAPEEMIEQQLFGTSEGSVGTGFPGIVEKAHMGTLLITSLDRLNQKCQARLVSVLQDEKVQRTGGHRFYPVSLRFIAIGSRKELAEKAAAGSFRKDLYEFLNQNVLEVPPLRDRQEDLPVLATIIARKTAQSLCKTVDSIDAEVFEKMTSYPFPGNIRELEGMIEAAIKNMGQDTILKLSHFPSLFSSEAA